jgi:hypothetical protein|nr:MAG TPA: replisome organizer protein [Caudoviricetes sp.]
MNSTEYKQVIKAHVMKAFARVGKNDQESLARMQILIDDIAERELPTEIIAKAFSHHAETSQFVPTLCDIMQYVNNLNAPSPQEEFNFLARFRHQATSCYAFTELDDDVHTVKKHIGARYVENSTMSDWVWIEKQAINIFRLLKDGKLELQENPNKHRVKSLPNGGRYIEETTMGSLKEGVGKIKNLLSGVARPVLRSVNE